jgi:hypothetical protein
MQHFGGRMETKLIVTVPGLIGYIVTVKGPKSMAMNNAEKQARWRQRHADQRRGVARVANLLLRQSHSDGEVIETKLGWNGVKFDRYFAELAVELASVLKTDRAINQLRWALHQCLWDRRDARWQKRAEKQILPPEARSADRAPLPSKKDSNDKSD